jgi:polyphosphate glucokinase
MTADAKASSAKGASKDTKPAGAAAKNGGAKAAAVATAKPGARKVLVVDVGGTHVKMLLSGEKEARKFDSGPKLTAEATVKGVRAATKDWHYDCVSIGYPGPVINGRPLREPHNLGGGWMGFDFAKAFGKPVKLVNDASMQAIGSYQGGKMLFLGLGTGLGSAMIVNNVLEPMELAHLQYRKGKTYEDYLGIRGLERMGKKKWRAHVWKVCEQLKAALEADYIVLGGGNVKKLKKLPPGTREGDNNNAFKGGLRLWDKSERGLKDNAL